MNLKSRFTHLLPLILLALVSMLASSACAQASAPQAKAPESLSAKEFARISADCSDEGGHFRSDNFTSNETSYLHVVDKMKQLGATGGAYLGVGPEQNFTYIAKLRPRIAFIIDIRRQAIIQHLMYKAVFHLAPTRAQFLAKLLSRPLPKEKEKVFAAAAPLNELLAYFERTLADEQGYAANLTAIRKAIQEDFQFALTELDQKSLEYVYKSFRDEGLEISYRTDGGGGGYFPTLKEILQGADLKGKQGNFLATVDDFEFVRGLHEKNLIIPVVGDFGGKKAIPAVADYLRKNGYTVSAFYTSNVEQYLFQNGDSFATFASNVKKLPLTEKSLFIRAIAGRGSHPARLPNHRLATLLQQMTVFVRDFDAGVYQTYNELINTHYITGDQP